MCSSNMSVAKSSYSNNNSANSNTETNTCCSLIYNGITTTCNRDFGKENGYGDKQCFQYRGK